MPIELRRKQKLIENTVIFDNTLLFKNLVWCLRPSVFIPIRMSNKLLYYIIISWKFGFKNFHKSINKCLRFFTYLAKRVFLFVKVEYFPVYQNDNFWQFSHSKQDAPKSFRNIPTELTNLTKVRLFLTLRSVLWRS